MTAPPLTPERTSYVSAKTPTARPSVLTPKVEEPSSSPLLGNGAQVLIVASIGVYVFGQIAFFTPWYANTFVPHIKKWCGVPKSAVVRGGQPPIGHSEMILPIYFLLFGTLPLLVSGLLLEFLRRYNLRRLSSHLVLKFAVVLRRKPALFGHVSYWSYGEWIFFWLLVGGNLFVFARYYTLRIHSTKARSKKPLKFNDYLENIGTTLGFSALFNFAFLFLPATRNSVWMEVFNISYANSIKYHRWLGIATVVMAVAHCVSYYWVWIRDGEWKDQALPCFDCALGQQPGHDVWRNVFGELALLMFLIMSLTSIPFVRRQFYNVFYYSHQLLFLAVLFAIMHWGNMAWWLYPTFIAYCFGRAMSMTSHFAPIHVEELTVLSPQIVKVVLKRSPGRDGQYKVGQFLYLNVPAISKLQWHAFTIASSPRSSPTTVTVLLKALGDWTKDLAQHATACKEKNVLPAIYVDGFYGASLEMYDEYSTVCLIGGGIGTTPIIAILDDLAAKLTNHKPLTQKIVFIFSFRTIALLEELHPILLRLKELDPQERYFKTHFYLTQLPSNDDLAHPMDPERLHGKTASPTTYASTAIAPVVLTAPLRSRSYRAFVWTTVVVVGVLILTFLTYGGGKIQRTHRNLWPLQYFVDAMVPMAAACMVFVYVLAERLLKQRASTQVQGSKDLEMNVFRSIGTPAPSVIDVHTYSDLLAHYNVAQGERPDFQALLTTTHAFHADASVPTTGKPVVGVFVSGPEAMKRAVGNAVHAIGTDQFDIHEEQFAL